MLAGEFPTTYDLAAAKDPLRRIWVLDKASLRAWHRWGVDDGVPTLIPSFHEGMHPEDAAFALGFMRCPPWRALGSGSAAPARVQIPCYRRRPLPSRKAWGAGAGSLAAFGTKKRLWMSPLAPAKEGSHSHARSYSTAGGGAGAGGRAA